MKASMVVLSRHDPGFPSRRRGYTASLVPSIVPEGAITRLRNDEEELDDSEQTAIFMAFVERSSAIETGPCRLEAL